MNIKWKIRFKSSALYKQQQNNIFNQIKRSIINIRKIVMFEKNIANNVWLKLILVIMYIKNNWFMRKLSNRNLRKISTHKLPNLFYFWILDWTIYIFLYKE